MKKWVRRLALLAAVGFAAPALAGNDVSDTATETGAKVRKTARDMKPGDKTAEDHVNDAKDTAKEKKAQGRKKARHAKKRAKHEVHEATR